MVGVQGAGLRPSCSKMAEQCTMAENGGVRKLRDRVEALEEQIQRLVKCCGEASNWSWMVARASM